MTASIPFTWGESSDLTVGLAGVSFPATGSTLDVLLNAVLSGIKVYNSSGNLLTNFNINAASGSVYSVNGVSSVVPIPAAVWLFGSGLIGLIGFSRKFS